MPRAGRMAKSSTLTSLPTSVQTGWAWGASCSQSIERADFVGFKVAPGDVAELRGIDQPGHGFAQRRETFALNPA